MNFLAVSASLGTASLSLMIKDREIMTVCVDRTIQPSRWFAGALELLAARGFDLRTAGADFICVDRGPGSFTGIKVALSFAKGLAVGLGCPVVGVTATEACAVLGPARGAVAVLYDAGKGLVYGAAYRRAPGVVEELVSPRVLRRDDAVHMADMTKGQDLFVVTDELIHGLSSDRLIGDLPALSLGVARAGAIRFRNGEGADEAALQPLYLRVSDAELSVAPDGN